MSIIADVAALRHAAGAQKQQHSWHATHANRSAAVAGMRQCGGNQTVSLWVAAVQPGAEEGAKTRAQITDAGMAQVCVQEHT